MKDSKKALSSSILSLMLCVVMLIGTTFAWFSDKLSSGQNIIQSGNLDIEMYWTEDLESGKWFNVEDDKHNTIFNYDNWEPGYTDVKYIKIVNAGSLALNYELSIDPIGEVGKLAEVINVYYANEGVAVEKRADLANLDPIGLLNSVMKGGSTANGTLLGKNQQSPLHKSEEIIVTLAMSMITTAGNEYQNKSIGDGFTITALATQAPFEEDSFGKDYDGKAEYPGIIRPSKGTVSVTPVDGKVPTGGVTIAAEGVSAIVPEGVALEEGVDSLTLTVTPLEHTTSDVTVVNGEILIPVDVHIEGVSDDNTVPIIIDLGAVLPKYLNMGNYTLIHVEESGNQLMECIAKDEDFTKHNQFKYDSDTGAVTVAMASFSEVALVADTGNPWNGSYEEVDTEFKGTGVETDPYLITNADELAGLSVLVSADNDDEDESNDWGSKYYKLTSDINIDGKNGNIFYPIGYRKAGAGLNSAGETWYEYGGAFTGTFDGAGHTITGIYQNTWAMDGNYDAGYYKAAMGLFGYVYNGTVKNLTIDNFNSEGEFAPTGCVTAYGGGGATFENIAITSSHPQTYNTGVAGIVGWDNGGDTADDASKYTFKNITVDEKTTISALWGSWDVAAAGIMGYLGEYSTANLVRCKLAPTIDVYNDVCGNYQYYWYRYCGMVIGTVDRTDAEGNLDLNGMITATECTVDFGTDRHEYYYCEFIENSIASYTHDYQFSRITHGELNYDKFDKDGDNLIDKNERPEDEAEIVCTHVHSDKTENINGEPVLVEDKRAVYIPFRQLFGGYGWGVDGVDEYDNIQITDITGTVEKFEVQDGISQEFLFRVGNQNAFPIGSLFKAKDNANINTDGVYVSVTSMVEGVEITGDFKWNESDWTQSTLKINGTGLAKISIQDYDFCRTTTLYVEVVDATNVTAYSELKNKNSVLLNDVTMSSDGSYYLSGATLYGNGFKFDVSKGAYDSSGYTSSNYLVGLNNAILDNVQITGAVYTKYGATIKDDYNRAVVLSSGNNTITNCYISNCASPIRVNGGNVEIVNTTLKGGNFANLDIRNGHVILDNITTINQVKGNDKAEDETVVVGLGVVVYYENVLNTTTVEVKNGITQYNHLSKKQAETYITDATAKLLTTAMFNSEYSSIQYSAGSDTWVNAGILSMTGEVGDDNISDVDDYVEASPGMSGVTGYIHTKKPDATSVVATVPQYATLGQGAIAPAYSFDYTSKNYMAKTDGSNDYCYEENGTVYIAMDDGDTFNWDTSILTATKNGQTLDYSVSMNGADYTGKSIAFNSPGDYEVTYTYRDSNNYSTDEEGNISSYTKIYEKTVHITVSVIKAFTNHAEFTFGSGNQATEKITVGNNTYISATGVSHDNSKWSYITVSGQKIYYPIVEATIVDKKTAYFNVFKDVVTITDYADSGTGAAVTYNSSTTTMPSGLTVVKGIYKPFADISSNWSALNDTALTLSGASKVFKYAGSADASSTPITYSSALCFKSPEVTNPRDEYITMVQYSYTDATNTTYYYYVGYHMAEKADGSCVTPDTLITMADGSQVRVDSLRGDEQLLVWNMETGKLDSAPIMFVDNEQESEVEVIKLRFSDETEVKVISEHGFWDYNLNKYVYLDREAEQYIGHEFAKQDGENLERVTLVDVVLENEVTTAWSPVTANHLCYFVNGMLSMPGGVGGLFNIFDVDAETMTYDYEAMARDIEIYGLFTYEELSQYADLSREMFDAAGGQYLKVSIGKGNLTVEELVAMIERYGKFF